MPGKDVTPAGCVLQIGGDALGGRMPIVPTYLKSCDFDGMGGLGSVVFTNKREEAMRFESAEKALEYWRTPSKVVPIRPDGRPNRPLTAFNVVILKDGMEPM